MPAAERNHYVPVRARVTGQLSDDDLERLGAAIRRAVAQRIALAQSGAEVGAASPQNLREQWSSDREQPRETAYQLPSYQQSGRVVGVRVAQREPVQQTALRRIHSLLSTGFFDWWITDEEAREVLHILQRLPAEPLLRVVMAMRLSGDWRNFLRNVPDAEWDPLTTLEMAIDRNGGYVVQGDEIRLEVFTGAQLQRDVSLEYPVSERGVLPMLLRREVPIAGLLPRAAAAAIADAYVEDLIYVDPLVRLLVTRRGYLYAPYHGPTSQSLWVEGRSRIAATSRDRPRRERRAWFASYIAGVEIRGDLVVNALHHYDRWIEQHYSSPEFLTREPSDLWAWALQQASQPAPVSALQPFIDLARSMTQMAERMPEEERRRTQAALGRYTAWVDLHIDDPQLARHNPVDVWVGAYMQTLRLEITEASARRAHELREAREHPPIDWEASGRKLDTAIRLMMARVWHMPGPQIAEDREAGVGYLIWGSELERQVRNVIASAFLHDQIARMAEPGYLATDAAADFRLWLFDRPQYLRALDLAHSHPDVEHYNIPEEEIPAWQTVIEVGISFIPVVGQIVGAGEASLGYDLFGHRMSTTSRAILAAGVLLPFAARGVMIGRAAVVTSRLTETYRLTVPEAQALFRATAQIRPGSIGARLLGEAVDDEKALRPVTDPQRLQQLGGLFRDMGMTERSTADTLRTRVEAELLAAERAQGSEAARAGGGGGPRPPEPPPRTPPPPSTPPPPAGGGPGVPTLLGRQRGAALRTDAAELERQIASLRQEADELERTASRQAGATERVARLQRRAAQRRRVATLLEGDVASMRVEAGEFERGVRSATADLPTADEVDILLRDARSETELVQVPLAQTERNPQLLPRLMRELMISRTGNRVVYRVEGGAGRRLVDVAANGDVTLTRGQTIFLNFGSPERAAEFATKGRARIVAFEVSEDWVRSARSAAVPEYRTGALQGRQPRLVDVRFADDQLEIPGSLVDELQQFVIPGSGRAVDVVP